jgi:MFS family permease
MRGIVTEKKSRTVSAPRDDGAMPSAPLSREARRVLVGTCLNALGNGFVLPFLVIYLHEVRGISLPVTGAIVAVQGGVGLVAVPVYGTLIDRVGARLVQLAALSMSIAGAVVLAYATGPAPAAVGVALMGLGGAGLWPAGSALVAELVPSEARPRYFGLSFALLNLGIGIGGIAGALIVRTGHPGTYQALFLGDAVTFLVFVIVLLSLGHVGGAQPAAAGDEGAPTSYLRLAREPAFRRMVVLQLVIVLTAYSQLDAAFPAFARQLGTSTRVVGLSFAVNTAVIVAGQMWVQRRTARLRRTRAYTVSMAWWAAAWVVLAVADRLPAGAWVAAAMFVYMAVFAVAEMIQSPLMPAIANDLADAHLRGRYNAAVSWSWAIGTVVGPVIGGALLGAHAHSAWIALGVAGCGAGAIVARRLEQVLPAAANGATPRPESADVAALGAATELKVGAAPTS